ncbi:MAG: CHASE2 domain-containing protein, partial [Spirochaetales bacterium]|nr:CHASE2 domain-containing protein [Spirochaetales bacterium]
MKKYFLSFPALLSLGLLLLFSLLHLWPAYERGDLFLYDIYLNMTPGPEEDDRLVLLNIDDLGIAEVGMFPWSRSIMADGLILMKEMGVSHAVFDIEYTEDSPMALNTDFLNEDMPELLSQE